MSDIASSSRGIEDIAVDNWETRCPKVLAPVSLSRPNGSVRSQGENLGLDFDLIEVEILVPWSGRFGP